MLPLLKQTNLKNKFEFMLCLSLFAPYNIFMSPVGLCIYLFLSSSRLSLLFLLSDGF